jgi:oxygen-independent coproporphyrinogen-3 oxidase
MALSTIKESFCMKKDVEISIEVNPASAIFDKLTAYKKAGINRISIGAQSLNDNELKKLGRVHNKEMFLETYENAEKAGFENINVDIMSALPDQSFDSYMSTLNRIVALKPQHISAYSLIIEEGTPFYDMDLHLPDEELDRKMYHATKAFLAKQGYHRYEISNYALNSPEKETFECCHNKVYWKRGNYLGLGLGAASMVENVRWNNTSDFEKYITILEQVRNTDIFHDVINEPLAEGKLKQTEKDVLHENIEFLDKKSRMEEFMFLGLRLIEGISIKEFKEVFNCDIFDIYGPVINKYTDMGLLEYSIDEDYLRLTEKGLDVSNTVMADFLLD